MYPITLGLNEAKKRIEKLIRNGHSAEALVTSMFTMEKTLMRTLKQIIISAGFTSKYAGLLIGNFRGLQKLKEIWNVFEPNNKRLIDIIGNDTWNGIFEVSKMRNKLVHGLGTYDLKLCADKAQKMLKLIDKVDIKLTNTYGYNGWVRISRRRKSTLHSDPKVRIDNKINSK